ncbi:MAG: glycosyltransferase [Verrucomicrobia bacterium]|jgi:glycosyltransferase involved in cell wall biosynthesis|nr:glycosyltransferase [Verrucomicrobiota bacterium]MBT7065910.1 glycosyltransferase [Verrucomicrobiota bacterium]MBT7701219.1 glycosyltransferase [Verrucomicrobiota bacterium]
MSYDFPSNWPRDLRVQLCHDWLSGMRGGERVLEILCEGFPEAPIYTLLSNPAAISDTIRSHPIHTSWMQRLPGISRHYRRLLPLFPAAINSLRPAPADLVISTSHCVAKSLRPHPGAKHISYCFTPMRYAWLFYAEYFGSNPAKALLVKPILACLRWWDRKTANRVDRFVGISEHVRERIQRCYGREADVVYPPVNTHIWTPDAAVPKGDFDLIVSALVPYKRVDLAVEAYTRSGTPLTIVGVGGQLARLKQMAGANITFLERASDETILDLYRRARLLVFPGEEDFGIVPLEAQSCGTPVVAYRKGGATETVIEDQTGVFFDTQTPDALWEAVELCGQREWDPAILRRHAERFGVANFIQGMADVIERVTGE